MQIAVSIPQFVNSIRKTVNYQKVSVKCNLEYHLNSTVVAKLSAKYVRSVCYFVERFICKSSVIV